MKTLSIVTAFAIIGLSALPALAVENERDTVYGKPTDALERSLRDRGIVTAGFEEWGSLIRAWVPNGAGGTSVVFIDPDTLETVTPGRS